MLLTNSTTINRKQYVHQKEHPVLSSSGSSLTSWLTPRQVYKKTREDPEIGSVMG